MNVLCVFTYSISGIEEMHYMAGPVVGEVGTHKQKDT